MNMNDTGNQYTAEQIVNMLSDAEVELSKGQTISEVAKRLGITEQTYSRWRHEYGGLRAEQVQRLKKLEQQVPLSRKRDEPMTTNSSPARITSRQRAISGLAKFGSVSRVILCFVFVGFPFVGPILVGMIAPTTRPTHEEATDDPKDICRSAWRHLQRSNMLVVIGSIVCFVFMFLSLPRSRVERSYFPGGSLVSAEERRYASESDNFMYAAALERVHQQTYQPPKIEENEIHLGGNSETAFMWFVASFYVLGAAFGLKLYRARCRSRLFREVLVPRWDGVAVEEVGFDGMLSKLRFGQLKYRLLGVDQHDGSLRALFCSRCSIREMLKLARDRSIEPVIWTRVGDLLGRWKAAN